MACLHALDIGPGDEVVLPANTFIATAACEAEQPNPCWPEPDEHTQPAKRKPHAPRYSQYQSPDCRTPIRAALRHGRHAAVGPEKIALCGEDNAQAQSPLQGQMTGGFERHQRHRDFYRPKAGRFGRCRRHHHQPSRTFAEVCLWHHWFPRKLPPPRTLGRNARLDTLQAAFLHVKLRTTWKTGTGSAAEIAARYTAAILRSCTQLRLPVTDTDEESVFHLYVVRARELAELQAFLETKGIQTLIHYPTPIHLQLSFPVLWAMPRVIFRWTGAPGAGVVSLPLYIGMTDAEIDYAFL